MLGTSHRLPLERTIGIAGIRTSLNDGCVSQFWTGCRPSETALRVSDIDLKLGTLSITKSRDDQHEAAPKTEGSVREIKLLPNVLDAVPQLLHADEQSYLFRNPDGGLITTVWWPKKSWTLSSARSASGRGSSTGSATRSSRSPSRRAAT